MQLAFDEWIGRVGERADIIEGVATPSVDGFLTVKENPALNTVYVERNAKKAQLICPKTEWRGRKYRFRFQDCVVLVARWMDANYNAGSLEFMRSISMAEYNRLNVEGYLDVIVQAGYVEQDRDPIHGDLLAYDHDKHIGVCIDGDKILHHPPNLFSSLDTLDRDRIVKVFRHANA